MASSSALRSKGRLVTLHGERMAGWVKLRCSGTVLGESSHSTNAITGFVRCRRIAPVQARRSNRRDGLGAVARRENLNDSCQHWRGASSWLRPHKNKYFYQLGIGHREFALRQVWERQVAACRCITASRLGALFTKCRPAAFCRCRISDLLRTTLGRHRNPPAAIRRPGPKNVCLFISSVARGGNDTETHGFGGILTRVCERIGHHAHVPPHP